MRSLLRLNVQSTIKEAGGKLIPKDNSAVGQQGLGNPGRLFNNMTINQQNAVAGSSFMRRTCCYRYFRGFIETFGKGRLVLFNVVIEARSMLLIGSDKSAAGSHAVLSRTIYRAIKTTVYRD